MSKSRDAVKQIRKATRRKFSAEEKIRIVLEGLRGEILVSELCRPVRESFPPPTNAGRSRFWRLTAGFMFGRFRYIGYSH